MNNNYNLINADIDQPKNHWLANKRKYKYIRLIKSDYILHLNYIKSMILAKKVKSIECLIRDMLSVWPLFRTNLP